MGRKPAPLARRAVELGQVRAFPFTSALLLAAPPLFTITLAMPARAPVRP